MPGSAEIDLGEAMKVRRLEAECVSRGIACRYVEAAAEGNHEVGEVAADADAFGRGIERRRP